MPVVKHQLQLVGGSGAPGTVTISRYPSGFAANGQSEVVLPLTLTVGPTGNPAWAAGYFEATLPSESAYADTGYYVIEEPGGRSHTFRVPETAGPHWLGDILTEVATSSSVLPVRLSGLRDTGALAAATVGQVPAWDGDEWIPSSGGGGGGASDHGLLSGLADDDHSQYHTDARGDVRYYTKAQADTLLAGKAATAHGHAVADVTGLQAALDGKAATAHTHAIADITGLQAALDALPRLAATTQAGSYTLALADAGTAVEFTSAGGANCTVPPNSAVAFPIGTVIELLQYGTGQITVVAGAGVTIRTASSLTSRAQYSVLSLRKRATDEWVLSGDAS